MTSVRPDKDVDNMVKLLLDSLKNVIFGDDKDIVHLSIIKIRQPENEEFITVRICESKLPSLDDVFDVQFHHSWDYTETLDLEKFM